MWVGMKSRFGQIVSRGPDAPPLAAGLMRNLLPLLLLTAGITALVLMYLWHDQSSYKALFGARDKVNAADMMSALDGAGIPYRIHPETGQVLVPEEQVGKARMLLASKGVTPQQPAGLELVEHNDPLGVSQFVQDVRFRRGLEGDLTQSIETLDAVDSARVHLSIAKTSSFVVSSGDKSSASVMVVLKAGHELTHEQIASIITLVSGSVAGLDPQRVNVVDQKGDLLSSRVDLTDGYQASEGNDAAKYYETQAQDNIRGLLEPVVGGDNYHASVTAEVDNDKVQETHEQYGDSPKVTNESVRQETDKDPMALGVPGSLSNRPVNVAASMTAASADAAPAVDASNPPPPASAPASQSSTQQKNAEARQYAYDRSVTQINRSRGRLHKISVAVVLNGLAAPGGKKAWSPEDLANVEKVLRTGLGIDSSRGDSLVVSTLAFPTQAAQPVWWQDRDNVLDMASWLKWPLALLAGWLLLARPLIGIARQRWATPRPVPAAAALAGPDATGALKRPDAAGQAAPAARSAMPVGPLLENYDLPPSGSSVDVMVDHLKQLAAKEPERVAEVVRTWVHKNARA